MPKFSKLKYILSHSVWTGIGAIATILSIVIYLATNEPVPDRDDKNHNSEKIRKVVPSPIIDVFQTKKCPKANSDFTDETPVNCLFKERKQ